MNFELENKLANELAEKIHKTISDFWKNYNGSYEVDFFYINSIVMSGLITKMTLSLIKEDAPLKECFNYVNNVGETVKNNIIEIKKKRKNKMN
jgi:hypothetical protein